MVELNKEERKDLKRISNDIKPQFNLGKSGMSEKFIETVDKYLDVWILN